VQQLSEACINLKSQVDVSQQASDSSDWRQEKEKEVEMLKEMVSSKDLAYKEIQTKLQLVTSQLDQLQIQYSDVSSQLEMSQVHLTQLRGSGGQELVRDRDQEIEVLRGEVKNSRTREQEAQERLVKLAGERDQLAEQYRSYSRDLATQAERLGEQLSKYQQENARLVQRESGLVSHVASLESQLQGYLKDGRNMPEEELVKLKDRMISLETDLRFSRDEKEKLQEMLDERGIQVDEMTQRLGMKDNEIMDLRASLSGLETTVDMLRSTSHSSGQDQAQLLAACQSDKVAASRAMQQNVSLKERLEELQGALVSLTNDKADVMDRLETANRKLSGYTNVEAEIYARDQAAKEKDIQLSNMKVQIKHLNEELQRRQTPEVDQQIVNDENGPMKELEEAQELIRSLNSQNSELRSKLEVLASATRECSESRSDSSASGDISQLTNRDAMQESSFSESSSSESFEEIGQSTATNQNTTRSANQKAESSDSFVDVKEGSELDNVQQTVISTEDLPFIPSPTKGASFQSLEKRFVAAMEQVAKLSLEKEEMEHLVERLQDETETIGDYVVMYQHQRQQHKLRLQEKEEQVSQLAKDKADLRSKLASLQEMITSLMNKQDHSQNSVDVGEDAANLVSPVAVSEQIKTETEIEKIRELIADIGNDSEHMIANCDRFQPWFWENSPHKVMTV